ncbi:fatty acid hydroxylase family protein [Aurantiacibacter xanthus]|uniref:Fatty acid hydroxylase family protein n=1 Tax=Aurantiacibacter xanthus TaxID=1784712 RepID=A0A3A1P1G0_9SPHN|nr:sterol desaturase family protein [Aurantiacibacter xanthus]RIV81631.1 fatty acid hydroxylase family protein [Aurantiacibacter xanthus]
MQRATNGQTGGEGTLTAAAFDADAPASSDTFTEKFKLALINAVPLATLLAVVAFWLLAPRSITANEWSLVVVTTAITFFILGLEFVLERHSGWRLTWKEFLTDLFYVILMATAIGWLVETFADGPLASVKDRLGLSTPWILTLPVVVQAFMVVFLIEFGQYWMHRWMHNWLPLWLTHAPHHHVTQLNAMKGAVGNPIELFLISLSVVALFDFDIVAIFCGLSMMTVISTFAHANVRSNPPLVYGFLFTTIRNHSLHHTALSYEDTRYNYGNSVIVFDRIFGTYRDGESAVVGQDDRKRLSIYEQFMFPFQPLLDKASAARAKTADADG